MKKGTIILLILIALAILAFIFRHRISAMFGGPKVLNGGQEPTQQDAECAGYASQRAVENCTRPLFQKVNTAKEKAWVMETADYPFDACLVNGKIRTTDGTTWYYNYQSGNKCIYINDNRFPAVY